MNREKIFEEYRRAVAFKSALGNRGLYEQTAINERFFAGDQWHGVAVGSDRPLVRHNVIKRIGDFKMSQLVSGKVTIKYSAEGAPITAADLKKVNEERRLLSTRATSLFAPIKSENETALVVSALNSYRETVARRVGLSELLDTALKNAFISGSGYIYTYFDPTVRTGLYADKPGGKPIMGDIAAEVIRAENVYFGDPACTKIQSQPYIILAEKKPLSEIVFEAEKAGVELPEFSEQELSSKQLLLTKLRKKRLSDGSVRVFATKVCEKFTVREEWDIGVRMYPLSQFVWEPRDNNAYGDSEVTYLIPNQIAINRMITASVWSAMTTGMPLMVVNGELVPEDITNDPGQIIRVWGTAEEIGSAVRFIQPPDFSLGYNESVTSLIENTLSQSGATNAALGDTEARNTSAIIELRDASSQPLALLKNRYHRFLEDISLIWAEFFVTMYGRRSLKITDENGEWYFPFDAAKYRDLLLSVSVVVRESVSKTEADSLALLSSLFEKGAISASQYIERLPSGILPDKEELARKLEVGKNESI